MGRNAPHGEPRRMNGPLPAAHLSPHGIPAEHHLRKPLRPVR